MDHLKQFSFKNKKELKDTNNKKKSQNIEAQMENKFCKR